MAQMVKNLPAMQETWVRSVGQEDHLEKGMATHSNFGVKIPWRRTWLLTLVFLPGEFHGQRSLVGHSSWGHKEMDMTEQLILTNSHWEDFTAMDKGNQYLNAFLCSQQQDQTLGPSTTSTRPRKSWPECFSQEDRQDGRGSQIRIPGGSQKSLVCTSFPLAASFFGIRSEVFTSSLGSSTSFLVSSFFFLIKWKQS